MIYNFYVFNRKGACLYYEEWNRPQVLILYFFGESPLEQLSQNTLSDDPDEDKKLMFGLIFSLKELVRKMAPKP
jgi:hypothetical protein